MARARRLAHGPPGHLLCNGLAIVRRAPGQLDLFGTPSAPPAPAGFRYQPDFVTPDEEPDLVAHLARLPFESFRFHGHTGNRRVVSFGWRYDFDHSTLHQADQIPPFLESLGRRAADFAGLADPDALRHVLVTEYAPGAGIGWHRDKAAFDQVVGVSLLAPCDFRFRRQTPEGRWERITILAAPRSAYLLTGPARTEWEHSIPPVDALRYSVTFRTLRPNHTRP